MDSWSMASRGLHVRWQLCFAVISCCTAPTLAAISHRMTAVSMFYVYIYGTAS